MNVFNKKLQLSLDGITVEGILNMPDDAEDLIIFSHGSGSSRFSARNNFIAQHLQKRGLGTFLFDLLTRSEDEVYSNRFDIELLSRRLVLATMQLKKLPASKNLEIGFFGASTGAASAIKAATLLPNLIKAVVSRGGRPDLVPGDLPHLKAPTLLIVGGLDNEVLSLNEQAYRNIPALKSLKIVKGATHLFEEPGALEEVARLSGDWFVRHMALENASGQIAQHV